MSDFGSELSQLSEAQKDELDDLTEDLINQLKYLGRLHRFVELWRETNYRRLDELEHYLINQSKLAPSTFSYVMNRVRNCYQLTHNVFQQAELATSFDNYIGNIERTNHRSYLQSHLEEIFTDDLDWAIDVIGEAPYYQRYEIYHQDIDFEETRVPRLQLLEEMASECNKISKRYDAIIGQYDDFMSDGGDPDL